MFLLLLVVVVVVVVVIVVVAAVVVVFSAVKRLNVIIHIQNKSFCSPKICVCAEYMYYVYINTHTCMFMFKKNKHVICYNMLCLYIKYIYI